MRKTKFPEAQIVFALRPANTGITVAEVCRKMGISVSVKLPTTTGRKSTAA